MERLPTRVHVFEDFETEIEKRWWLRGSPETNSLAPSLSATVPNRRALRAAATKDFDDLQGDPRKNYKAVVFNPVPGPPMGAKTRLSFRYHLHGTDTLRVQIYSLSKGYHRFLLLTNLPNDTWQAATVDMTTARRPDGSGGPLATDERIDDIQFYISPDAELVIDDIVLFEAAPEVERRAFPRRMLFTGWFDTGQQGSGREWPGEFEIVKHDAPRTWKAAKSVRNPETGESRIRVQLRGQRPLSAVNHLRFQYRLTGVSAEDKPLLVAVLANTLTGRKWRVPLSTVASDQWAETSAVFRIEERGAFADELQVVAPRDTELWIDDLLLFEAGEP